MAVDAFSLWREQQSVCLVAVAQQITTIPFFLLANHSTKQLVIDRQSFYALSQLATQLILVQALATYNTRHHLTTDMQHASPLAVDQTQTQYRQGSQDQKVSKPSPKPGQASFFMPSKQKRGESL
jgi:hypothetical protein